MPPPDALPLAAQLFSQASLTALVQVLANDREARVTALDAAPAPAVPVEGRAERLRLVWQGPKGTGRRALLLTALPSLSWSEAVNPHLPAPTEVLLVEGDLSAAFSQHIEDGAVAAGRRRGERPAWRLDVDWSEAPELAAVAGGEALAVERLAALHALHWGALPVLDQVYPWLPRFAAWVRGHCAFLAALLAGRSEPERPYERWAWATWPRPQRAAFKLAAAALPAALLAPLRAVLADPAPLLDSLAAAPQTILHGTWRRAALRWYEGQPLAADWRRAQVGPAAWDLCCYAGLPTPATMEQYLNRVAETIPELSEADRRAFHRSVPRCALLAALLELPALAGNDTEPRAARLGHLAEQLLREVGG